MKNFILKFRRYNKGNEVGAKYFIIGGVDFYETCYEKVKITNKEKEKHFKTDLSYSDLIYDKKAYIKNKEYTFLRILFRKDGDLLNQIYYTDNEVFICNDKNKTIDHFIYLERK
jgi:hypothetical protein